jgi:hypothetical protein
MLDTGIGKGLLEIAFALMSIALIALLLSRSRDTATVVKSISSNFNELLRTVTLQGQGIGQTYY